MNCPNCMQPSSEEDVFCKSCGTRLVSDNDTISSTQFGDPAYLNSFDNILLVHSNFKGMMNFTFQDQNENNVALTQGKLGIPLKFIVMDTDNRTLFRISAERVKGLMYNSTVLDPQGKLLATIKPKSGIGKKFEVDVAEMNPMLLKSDMREANYELLMQDGSVIAKGHGNMMAILKERVEIVITSGTPVDRRVILASFLLLISSMVR